MPRLKQLKHITTSFINSNTASAQCLKFQTFCRASLLCASPPPPPWLKHCPGHDCSLWTALYTTAPPPPQPTWLSTLLFMCLFANTKSKACPVPSHSYPRLYCISTQLGSTSHHQPSLRVLGWKLRPAKGLAALDKRSLCFPALPPCPETTRLSFLLCWLWEGPLWTRALQRANVCWDDWVGYLQQDQRSES